MRHQGEGSTRLDKTRAVKKPAKKREKKRLEKERKYKTRQDTRRQEKAREGIRDTTSTRQDMRHDVTGKKSTELREKSLNVLHWMN